MNKLYVDETWDHYLSALQDGIEVKLQFVQFHTTEEHVRGICQHAVDKLGMEADIDVVLHFGFYQATITPR